MFHRLSSVTPLLVVALVFQLLAMACGPMDGRLAAPRTAPDKETERPAAQKPDEHSEGLTCLEQEIKIRIEADGRARRVVTRLVRFESREAIERFGTFTVPWAPWREERPEVQAVVRLPDGDLRRLSPRTVTEEPVPSNLDDKVMTDRRRLLVPLPGLVVGATMTLRVVVVEKRALSASGAAHVMAFIPHLPILRSRVIVEVPTALKARIEVVGPGIRRRDLGVRWGRQRLQFEAGPYTSEPLWEPLLPYDRPPHPYVVVSTAPSWKAVAQDFHRVVNRQIQNVPSPAARVTGSRDERIAALLAQLRERVRYTSLTFGEAAIVPRTPMETLRRGFGDCKDMSALLVAWLRAADIPAQVALVRAGFGEDTLPKHPGLDWFNHAVVYVPGPRPLFIDPTARYTEAQRAPLSVQGRLALVIDPGTTALQRIPGEGAEENRVEELREVFLRPEGGARIVEVSQNHGAPDSRLRADVDRLTQAEAPESFGRYLQRLYGTEGPAKVTHPDPRDLRRPFVLRLEGQKASAAQTEDDQATVQINHNLLFQTLPGVLSTPPPEGNRAATRRFDLHLPEPHRVILRYRIHPPPGYALRSLPENGHRQLGPLRVTYRYEAHEPTGRVEARLELIASRQRLTPREVGEVWRSLRRLREQPETHEVVFEHRAVRLRKEGRWKEAIALVGDLRRAAPGELAYVRQHVNLLLGFGYGQAAQEEARRAAAAKPKDSEAWYLLGQVLERNDLGVQHAEGWDRDGVLSAYRRAVALAPRNATYRGALGRILALNRRGLPALDPAALRSAIIELQAAQKLDKGHESGIQLASMLLLSGRYAELEALTPLLGDEVQRAGFGLAVVALRRGVKAAHARLRKVTQDQDVHTKHLGPAVGFLVMAGKYHEAAALMAPWTTGEALADRDFHSRFARVKPFLKPPEADSLLGVARRLLYRCLELDLTPEQVAVDLAPPDLGDASRKALVFLVGDIRRYLSWHLSEGWGERMNRDATLSLLKVTSEGSDDLGHMVSLSVDTPGHPSPGISFNLRVLAVRTATGYAIAGGGRYLAEAGVRALKSLDLGDLTGARRWLDLALGGQVAPADPWETLPFVYLWKVGSAAPADRVRLAAAALLALRDEHQAQAATLLSAAFRRPLDPATRRQAARALGAALLGQAQPARAEPIWRRLAADHPDEIIPFRLHMRALALLGRFRDIERLERQRQKRRPEAKDRQVALASAIAHQPGRLPEAVSMLQRLIDGGKPPPNAYNERAWLGLFLPTLETQAVIAAAEQAVRLDEYRNYSSLDTLAVAYAEAGRLADAREIWLRQLKAAKRSQPKGIDWYTYGRIAEQIGLLHIAREAYRRIPESKDPHSTHILTQRRLKLLGAAPATRPQGTSKSEPEHGRKGKR